METNGETVAEVVQLTPRQKEILSLLAELGEKANDRSAAARHLVNRLGIRRASADGHLDRLRLRGLWGVSLNGAAFAPAQAREAVVREALAEPAHMDLLRACANHLRQEECYTRRRREERDELLARLEHALEASNG